MSRYLADVILPIPFFKDLWQRILWKLLHSRINQFWRKLTGERFFTQMSFYHTVILTHVVFASMYYTYHQNCVVGDSQAHKWFKPGIFLWYQSRGLKHNRCSPWYFSRVRLLGTFDFRGFKNELFACSEQNIHEKNENHHRFLTPIFLQCCRLGTDFNWKRQQ